MRDWEEARRYYADAHFAPTPHVEVRAGLERVYHQIKREDTTDTLEVFLKDTEAEYRIREDADREKIRQKLIVNRLNEKATDFRLETWKARPTRYRRCLVRLCYSMLGFRCMGATW